METTLTKENTIVVYNNKYYGKHHRFNDYETLSVSFDTIEETKKKLLESYRLWRDREFESNNDREWTEQCKAYARQYIHAVNSLREIKSKDYKQEERNTILYNQTPKEITEEEYDEMLCVLPPMGYNRGRFFMSEMITGSYTREFFKRDNKYYTVVVDFRDKSTWY